jgi:hypothetical protein
MFFRPNIPIEEEIRNLYDRAFQMKPYLTNSYEEEQYLRNILKLIARLKVQSQFAQQNSDEDMDKSEYLNMKN